MSELAMTRPGVVFTPEQKAMIDELVAMGAASHDTEGLRVPADTIHCCARMQESVDSGFVQAFEDGSRGLVFPHEWGAHTRSVSFCPFCGTAVLPK